MKKIVGVLVAFCVGAFLRPAVADTVFNINQTVPNSCIVGVIGVSDNTANATANWSPNTYNCAAGTYLPAGNDWANDSQGCTQCPANSYCTGGTYTYNESTAQGLNSCPTGYTSAAGTGAISQCQINCPANTYINITGGAYTRLEYLESTGTQWIDTGYKPKSNGYRATGKLRFVGDQNDWSSVLGVFSIGANYAAKFGKNFTTDNWSATFGGDVSSEITWNQNTDYEFDVSFIMYNKWLNIDNATAITSNDSTPIPTDYNIYLFTYNRDGSAHTIENMKGRLYRVSIYDDNSANVRDFVPTRRNSDNELGMLDLVTGQFFTNAGTGTFIAGPDVGPIGGSCTACAAGYHSAAHTVNYGTADSCTANVINISWKNATGAEQAATTCTYDSAITTPTNEPVKRGYTFTGWTLSAQ